MEAAECSTAILHAHTLKHKQIQRKLHSSVLIRRIYVQWNNNNSENIKKRRNNILPSINFYSRWLYLKIELYFPSTLEYNVFNSSFRFLCLTLIM